MKSKIRTLLDELMFELVFGLTSLVAALSAIKYFYLCFGCFCLAAIALCMALSTSIRMKQTL